MSYKLNRRSFITGSAALLAAGSLGMSAFAFADGKTEAAATAEDMNTFTTPAGVEVSLKHDIQTAAIDQVPLAATYVMYKGGTAEGLIGLSGSVMQTIQQTLLPTIAPDILEADTSYYENGELNVETLLTLNPDVVLYNGGNSEHAEMFEQAGLPAVGFSTSGDPTTLYTDWLHTLEQVYEEPGKMDEVIKWGTDLLDEVAKRVADIADEDRRRVMILFSARDGQPFVSGSDQGKGGNVFGHYWMQAAGVTNVAAELSGSETTDMEKLYDWNPEIMFLTGPGQANTTVEDILANTVDGMDFSPMTCVQEGKVYSNLLGMWSWMTPNPDAPLVVLWMASTAYPELFEDIDLEEKTREYYELGYHYQMTDEEVASIYADSHVGE